MNLKMRKGDRFINLSIVETRNCLLCEREYPVTTGISKDIKEKSKYCGVKCHRAHERIKAVAFVNASPKKKK